MGGGRISLGGDTRILEGGGRILVGAPKVLTHNNKALVGGDKIFKDKRVFSWVVAKVLGVTEMYLWIVVAL